MEEEQRDMVPSREPVLKSWWCGVAQAEHESWRSATVALLGGPGLPLPEASLDYLLDPFGSKIFCQATEMDTNAGFMSW